MNLADKIRALPSIKDEAGGDCVSREVVLEMVRGATSELIEKWRARANEEEYKLHKEWAIDQCADELEAVAGQQTDRT